MNQSNWFSLDEVELEQKKLAGQIDTKPPKPAPTNSMDSALSEYQTIELNQNLVKYVVEEAKDTSDTTKVNEKSRIKVTCEERDSEGNILNKNGNNIQATKIAMASNIPMIQGLKTAFLSMYQGEIAWFKISNEQLYTPQEIASQAKVANIVKYYKISMIEVSQPAAPLDLSSLEGRLKQMEAFREEGNEYYKKEQYTSAITRYQKGLNFLEKWPKKFEDDLTAIRAKKESLLALSTNKAQCYLKLGQYQDVIKTLEPVIDQMRNTQYEVKSYYRLINSLVKMNETERAQDYFTKVQYLCQLTNEESELLNRLIRN